MHAVWEDEDNMAASITTKGADIFVEVGTCVSMLRIDTSGLRPYQKKGDISWSK